MNPSRALHPAAGRDVAADGRTPARRRRRLSAAAGLGAAASGLSDDPGRDVLSGRQPGRDGLLGHGAARAAVRTGAGPEADDVDQLRRRSVITLQFALDLNIDVAEQEVQAAINAAGTFLPADLPNPPIYSKTNPADAPILTLALTSKTLPLSKVEDLADTRLAQKISQLSGRRPGQHQRRPEAGGPHSGEPDVALLAGLKLEDLRTAVAAANVNQAKGNFDGSRQAYTIGANDQLLSSDRVPAARHRLSERRAGASVRRRERHRRRRERQAGGLDERRAGGDPQHSAAAGREHHRGRRSHQGAAAAAPERCCPRRCRCRS